MTIYREPLPPHLRVAKAWLQAHRISLSTLAAELKRTEQEVEAELDRTCAAVSKPMFRAMQVLSGMTARTVSDGLLCLMSAAQQEN